MDIQRLIENFEFLGDWQEKYDYITELGGKLPPMPESEKTEASIVHGCLTRVWVTGTPDPRSGAMAFHADAEGPLIKGLVALLVFMFDGKRPEEVLATDAEVMIERLGLDENLSPNRHLGMFAMVDKIKGIAKAHTSSAPA